MQPPATRREADPPKTAAHTPDRSAPRGVAYVLDARQLKASLPPRSRPLPSMPARSEAGRHRSAVEQIFQDGSCAAGAFLATEIDIRRHARPAVPKLVCGVS
jgi:hypothetical protein